MPLQDDQLACPGPADHTTRPIESATRPPVQDDHHHDGWPDGHPVHDQIPHHSGYVSPARPSSVVHDCPLRAPPSPPATHNEYQPLPP